MSPFRSHDAVARVFAVLGLTLAGGCSAPPPEETREASDPVIIGANEFVPVAPDGANVPARYRASLDAFGRVLIPGSQPGTLSLCTATHVGNGVVVSAGHCFRAPAARTNNQGCSGTKIEWGSRAGKAPTLVSSCTQIVAMETNDGRDYAVLRVSPVPLAAVGIDLSTPPPGTPLTIFSHPGGRPLEWSKTCSLMVQGGDHFGYQCDTQGGSSGAAVLRDDTLKVVGIHWGGGGTQNSATYLARSAPDTLGGLGGGSGGAIRPAASAGLCLDVEGARTDDGTNVLVWGCHGGDNQRWGLEGGALRVYGNKCLDVAGGNDVNGARVQIWECGAGNPNQQWVRAGEYYQWAGHNKCMDLRDGRAVNGNPIQLWDCTAGNTNQHWTN